MPNNTYDRYVTWAMEVPEGVAVPSLMQWGMPVFFPDETFFPKNIVPMYAIRNPADGTAATTTGENIPAPAGVWFIWTPGSGYGMVADDYFTGGIPDTSGGTQYPPEADREIDPEPPPWVGDPTPPGPGLAEPTDTPITSEETPS